MRKVLHRENSIYNTKNVKKKSTQRENLFMERSLYGGSTVFLIYTFLVIQVKVLV
jgi:hypothetical protein